MIFIDFILEISFKLVFWVKKKKSSCLFIILYPHIFLFVCWNFLIILIENLYCQICLTKVWEKSLLYNYSSLLYNIYSSYAVFEIFYNLILIFLWQLFYTNAKDHPSSCYVIYLILLTELELSVSFFKFAKRNYKDVISFCDFVFEL